MSDETASQSRIRISWLIGVAVAFVIFAFIGGYSKRMTNDYSDYDQQRAEVRKETLTKVQTAENALINPVDDQGKSTAEWVDQTKGAIRIPIDEAMAHEVDALKGQAVAIGAAIAVAAPAPAPAASTNAPAAATNTPAATTNAPAAAAPPAKSKESKK